MTARFLGAGGRGQIALIMTIGTVASTLALLGVEQATVNLAGREPRRRPALATNAVLIAAVVGVGTSAALVLLTHLAPGVAGDLSPSLVAIALGAIPLLVARTYLQALAEADYRFAWSAGTRLVSPFLAVTVNGALAAIGVLTVGSAAATWVLGQGVALLALVWFVIRRSTGFGRPDPRLARRALSFGLQSHLGRVMNLGNYRLDQWLVGALVGSRELGRYSVAVALSEALFFLPTALASAQRPDLVRATPGAAARRAAHVFRAAIVATIPLAIVLIAIAPALCVTLFGDEFRGSADDLRVLCLGAFGIVAVKLLGDALTAQRRPLLATAAAGIGLAFTVALDLILIPPHGGLGAAVASAVAYLAAGVAAGVLFTRALDARPGELLPRRGDVGELVAQGASIGRHLARRVPGRTRPSSPRT